MNPRILHHKVPRASIISECEVSITVLCTPCSPPLHSSTNQELFEKYACNQSSYYAEIRWYCVPQLSSETEISITLLCQLFLTCYTAVRIKNCLKSTSAIKVETIKNMDDFRYTKEAITCNHQINAFHCQQR